MITLINHCHSNAYNLSINNKILDIAAFAILVIGIVSTCNSLPGISNAVNYCCIGTGAIITFVLCCVHIVSKKLRAPQLPTQTEYAQKQEEILQAIQKGPQTSTVIPLPNLNDPKLQNDALAAEKEATRITPGKGVTRFSGGFHSCIITDKIPGVIFKKFKRNSSETSIKAYIDNAQRARNLCATYDLNLLFVPQCQKVTIGTTFYIMEELCDIEHSFTYQENLYQWAISDERMQSHVKNALKQLATFICLFGFADVTYHNIAFTKEGRIALFDLDSSEDMLTFEISNTHVGLFMGGRSGGEGLFSVIPPDWFEEFSAHIQPHLQPSYLPEFEKSLSKAYKQAQQRQSEMHHIASHMRAQNIVTPSQPLIFRKEAFVGYHSDTVHCAKLIIKHINEKIKTLNNMSLINGRKIKLGMLSEISPELSSLQYKTATEEVFEVLKKAGYIYSYSISHGIRFSIVC